MMPTPASVIGVLLLTAALSGCSGTSTATKYGAGPLPTVTATTTTGRYSSAPTGSTAGPAASGSTLSIKDFSFTPAALTVKSGTKVSVTNNDSASHTWTATDKTFDSGDLATGKSFTFTFTKPGTYSYVCSIHAAMHGTVTVTS